MAAINDNTDSQQSSSGGGGNASANNPYGFDSAQWDQLGNMYQTLLGRTGSADEMATHFVNGRLDPNAYQNIYGSPEASAFRAKPPAPKTTTPTTPATQDWTQGPWDANRVKAYFASRGVTPNDTSPDYWAQRWNEWGKNDPAYFLQRLSTADEFGGGGAGASGGAPSGGNSDFSQLTSFLSAMKGNDALDNVNVPDPQSQFTSHYQMTPQESDLYNQLVQRSNQSLSIDPQTDAVIRPQVDAFAAQQDKESRHALDSIAESAGPYASGTLMGQRRMLAENAAQSTNALQAQLVQNELTSRRQEIQNALQERGSMLSQQDQLSLQRELSLINDQLQKASAKNQYMLGLGSLGLGQQQINSANDQFNARFGLDSSNQANYWDALRRGLLG